MKAQFTSGPYGIVTEHDDQEFIKGTVQIIQNDDAQGFASIALVYTVEAFDTESITLQEYDDQRIECEANARLLKHAPEMFYALQWITDTIDVFTADDLGIKEEVIELRKLIERVISGDKNNG